LPTIPPRPAYGPAVIPNLTVSDLWKEGLREWNPVIFEGVLNPEDQQLAESLYLSKYAVQDSYEWAYTKNAQYSVRSGYWVATHVHFDEEDAILPPPGSIALKKEIWKLPITPKICHFLWRCLSGALATATQLRTRMIPADPICQKCCQADETVNHILFTCPFADVVWKHANSIVGHNRFSDSLEYNFGLMIQFAHIPSLPHFQRLLPFWIVWRLWKSRNDFLFKKIMRLPQTEVHMGRSEANEWLEANNYTEDTRGSQLNKNTGQDRGSQWRSPPRGWVKCNFDSGFMLGRSFTNTGWLIRDDEGKVLFTGCAKLPSTQSPLQAEATGLLHVLQIVWARGIRNVCFEGDNQELITTINNGDDHSQIGDLLFDIRHWMAKLSNVTLLHVNRERNSAADKMAQYVLSTTTLYQSFIVPPRFLLSYLYQPYTI